MNMFKTAPHPNSPKPGKKLEVPASRTPAKPAPAMPLGGGRNGRCASCSGGRKAF